MSQNKVFFIINKYSGTGYQSKIEGRIIDICAELKLEAIIEETQHRGHATELARQAAAENIPTVFAMGGDGTVNEVAQGLIGTSTVMGILPKGSGNGLARHLQIPLHLDGALQLLKTNKILDIDILRVNGKISLNVSGIGFDGHVAGKFGQGGRRGLFGYFKLVLKEFASYKEFTVNATMDSKSYNNKSFIIALANSSQFGNNAICAPSASVCDGTMEVCFIKKVPLINLADFTIKMFNGKIEDSRFVEIVRTSRFEAAFEHPLSYHIDGEAYPAENKFVVEIERAALKMIVPAVTSKIL